MKCPTSTGVHARPTMYQEGVPRGAIILFYVKCPLTPVPPPTPEHVPPPLCMGRYTYGFSLATMHRLSKCYIILINPLGNFCFVSQVLVKRKVVDMIEKVQLQRCCANYIEQTCRMSGWFSATQKAGTTNTRKQI